MNDDFKIFALKPVREDTAYQDVIEKKIKEVFKKYFYEPLIQILNMDDSKILNTKPTAVEAALKSDRIFYEKGRFGGKFNAAISQELRAIGATWDQKTSTYKIKLSQLPTGIRNVISSSKAKFEEKTQKILAHLSRIDPDELVNKLHIVPEFDKTLKDFEKRFAKNIKKISVAPQLSDVQRKKVSEEWQNNLKLYFKKYVSDEQIPKLRQVVQDNAFSGYRRESLVKGFMDSYGVSKNKAKFWARQETNLLMAKYKETKYVGAGVPDYRWACVKMPHQPTPNAIYKPGEVRYSHGILEGKIFSWKDPPVTTAPNKTERRNNPGQDYNCRCFAIPIVRF